MRRSTAGLIFLIRATVVVGRVGRVSVSFGRASVVSGWAPIRRHSFRVSNYVEALALNDVHVFMPLSCDVIAAMLRSAACRMRHIRFATWVIFVGGLPHAVAV